jgi:adenosylhomocysteine nucleosidase
MDNYSYIQMSGKTRVRFDNKRTSDTMRSTVITGPLLLGIQPENLMTSPLDKPIENAMDTQTISETKVLLIFTPIKAEHTAVNAAVSRWNNDTPESIRTASYENIVIEQIGVRGVNLREILPRYSHRPVIGVITAGIAGALAPELDIGDLVIDNASTDADRVVDFMNTMTHSRRVYSGSVYTSKSLISSPEEKKKIYNETQSLIVEMEHHYTRQFAARRSIPWLGIRAVSDTAFDQVPPEVMRFVNKSGNIRPWGITLGLAWRPQLIPQVVRLGKNTNTATQRLTDGVGAIMRSGWPF